MELVWCLGVNCSTVLVQLQQRISCQSTPIDISEVWVDGFPWIGECALGSMESAVHAYMQVPVHLRPCMWPKDFKINPLLHGEPMQINEDRGDVIVFVPFGDDTSRMILTLLKLGYELLRNTKQAITVIQPWCYSGIHQLFNSGSIKILLYFANGVQIEINWSTHIRNMVFQAACRIKNNSKVLGWLFTWADILITNFDGDM